MKFSKVLFVVNIFFTLNCTFVFSSQVPNENYFSSPIIKQAFHEFYNLHFQKADSLCNIFSERFPTEPDGFFLKCKILLWEFIGSRDETNYLSLKSLIKRNLTLIENKIDVKAIPKYLYLKAASYSMLATLKTLRQDFVDAFWDAKKADGIFEDILDDFPNDSYTLTDFGMLKYALGFADGFLSFTLKLTGMSGDKQEGLAYLRKAVFNSPENLGKPESKYYLSQVYVNYLNEIDSAFSLISPLVENNPDNILFKYQLALVLINKKEFEKAESLLNVIIKSNNPKFPFTYSLALFLKGEIRFLLNDFKNAEKYYNLFLENQVDISYSGLAKYKIGICQLMKNEILPSKRSFILCRLGNLEIEEDKFAKRRGELLFDINFSQAEKNILLIENYLETEKLKKAETLLNEIEYSLLSDNFKELYLFFKGKIFLKKGKVKEAENIFKKCLTNDVEYEKWIIPTANLHLSRIYFELQKFELAEEYIENADDENEYDFKNKLSAKINFWKRKIERRLN